MRITRIAQFDEDENFLDELSHEADQENASVRPPPQTWLVEFRSKTWQRGSGEWAPLAAGKFPSLQDARSYCRKRRLKGDKDDLRIVNPETGDKFNVPFLTSKGNLSKADSRFFVEYYAKSDGSTPYPSGWTRWFRGMNSSGYETEDEAMASIDRLLKKHPEETRDKFRIIGPDRIIAATFNLKQWLKTAVAKPPTADQLAERAHDQYLQETTTRDIKIAMLAVVRQVEREIEGQPHYKARKGLLTNCIQRINFSILPATDSYAIEATITVKPNGFLPDSFLPVLRTIAKAAKPLMEAEAAKIANAKTTVKFMMEPPP